MKQPVLDNNGDTKEDCPVCFESLEIHKSVRFAFRLLPSHPPADSGRSLPCDHLVCTDCFVAIPRERVPLSEVDGDASPAPDEEYVRAVRCPNCRGMSQESEAVVVQLTATEQWEGLLAVASEWAQFDQDENETIGSDVSDTCVAASLVA